MGGNVIYTGSLLRPPVTIDPNSLGPYTAASYDTGVAGSLTQIADYIIFYPTDAPTPMKSGSWSGGLANNIRSAPERLVTNYVETDNQGIARWLATWGYVTMQTQPPNTNGAGPSSRALSITQAIDRLIDENSRSGSPLFGKLDTSNFFASGQSNGGAGAWLASVSDSRIKVNILFEPVSDTGNPANITVPTLILSAQNGAPADGGSTMYSAIGGSVPKILAVLKDVAPTQQTFMHDAARAIGAKWWVNDAGALAALDHTWDSKARSLIASTLKRYLSSDTNYTQFITGDASALASFSSANIS